MRYRGHYIERIGCAGDYAVYSNIRGPGLKNRDLVFVRPAKWGLAQTKADIDALLDAAAIAEREDQMRIEARRRRELERAEAERRWMSRLPSTSCRRCGAHHVEAIYHGGKVPLDLLPTDDGDWVVYGCRIAGRVPLVRRAEPGEPIADRYEIHHASCPARPPMADPNGQLRLRLGKRANLLDRPERRRARHQARQLSLAARAEQLEFISCRSESPTASHAAPPSGGR